MAAALGLLVVAASPAVGRPQGTQTTAPMPASLADRIQNAVDRYQSSGARPSLEELKALMDEAATAKRLDPGLAADLATIYAYSLARAQRGQEAITVIMAAQDTYARAGFAITAKMGDLLLAQAAFQDLLGDTPGAYATKTKALGLYEQVEGPDGDMVATVKVQLAFSLFAQGRLDAAITAYRDALPRLAGKDSLVRVYAMQLTNYAGALRLAGDLDGALDTSRRAVAIAREKLPAGHPALMFGLNTLGATLMDMGRYGEAEAVLREGLDLARQYRGKQSLDTAGFTYRLAQVLHREGHASEARALLDAALDDLAGVNMGANPDLPGLIRLELGQIALDDGDLSGAQSQLTAGLTAIAATGDTGATTRARLNTRLAEAFLLDHRYDVALASVSQAMTYYERDMPDYAPDRVRAAMLQALVLSRLGRQDEAFAAGQAVEAAMRAHLDSYTIVRAEQTDLVAAYQLSFVRFADLALEAGHPDTAFAAAQMAAVSEVSTTSLAMAARSAISDPKAADLARRLQDTQVTRLRLDRERTYARGKSDAEVKRLENEIQTLDVTLTNLAGELNAVFPDFGRLSHPRPLSVDAARATLGRSQAVVMPLLSDDRLITLTLTPYGLNWASSPLGRAQALTAVTTLRGSVDTALRTAGSDQAAFARAPAWLLGQAIFTPHIRTALGPSKELEILGSGPIMTLPFALLLTEAPQGEDTDSDALRNSAWLIRSYALSVKPAFIARTTKLAEGSGFLGVGAPVLGPPDSGFMGFDPDAVYRGGDAEALRQMPSLPHAEGELQRMDSALALPGSQVITGADATEARIKATDLSRYSVIAFATHGLISGNLQTLREPALVLTPPAQSTADDDGLLTASDVAGLRLKARWVILSACNTGSGREAGAAGYSGLARAFMQAGADSLLVSLWPVRDDVADRLGVDTVRRNAKGASQAQSLRRAMLDLLSDSSVKGSANPAIWAPFSLVVR